MQKKCSDTKGGITSLNLSHKRLSLVIVFFLFFIAIAVPGTLSQTRDTLTYIHTSDIHIVYGLDQFHPVFAQRHANLPGGVDSLERFFDTIPGQVKADGVIITGDLIEMYEAKTKTRALLANQVDQFRSLYNECPVPLYLTLGNHDLTSYSVKEPDSSIVESQTCAGRARASWIRTLPCFHDGTYYTKTFQVGKTTYHFVFLDNGYSLHDNGRVIDKEQFDWLREQVSRAGDEPVILFFHVYFPVGDINGDGISFKENGPLHWPGEKECSEGLLKLLNEGRNIKALVVGHGHSNVVEGIHFPSGNTIYQIETGSVTEGSTNWRLFRFTESGIIVARAGSREAELKINVVH